MQKEIDHIEVILTNREYLYRLLQTLFGNEPSSELLKQLSSDHLRQSLDLFYDSGVAESDSFVAMLDKLIDKWQKEPEQCLDRLANEYTRLFYGPGVLIAPPWESVYVDGEQVLFQEATLRVRQTYVKHHFLPDNYPNEPDDHIAYELDFMCNLATLTREQLLAGKANEAIELLQAQKNFLQEHLLKWVGRFANDLKKAKNPLLYPGSAAFMAYYLKSDDEAISELLSFLNTSN